MSLGSSETGQSRSQQRLPLNLTSYLAVHQGGGMICYVAAVHLRRYTNVLSWGGCGIGWYMCVRQYVGIEISDVVLN